MHNVSQALLGFIHGDGLTVLPQLELLLFAAGILVFDLLLDEHEKHWNAYLALLGLVAAGAGLFLQANRLAGMRAVRSELPGIYGFQNTVVVDGFSIVFNAILLAASLVAVLLSLQAVRRAGKEQGRHYALVLFGCIGMTLIVSSCDLVPLFFAVEVAGVALALLLGTGGGAASRDASVRLFVMSAFSSGLLAYGFSLLYGLTGTTNLWDVGGTIDRRFDYVAGHGGNDWLVVLAFLCVSAALFFKLPAVPLQQWLPEIYERAATPVCAMLSAVFFTGAFAAILRVFIWIFGGSQPSWKFPVAAVAVATMIWGGLGALFAKRLKKLLAYSVFSNAGFALFGFVGADQQGITGMIVYVLAYSFATLGLCAVIAALERPGEEFALYHLDGLFRRSPLLAVLLAVFALSLAGIPLTSGFKAKYLLFESLTSARYGKLAALFAFGTLPWLYCYLRLALHAFLPPTSETRQPEVTSGTAIALGIAAFVSLAAGMYADPFLRVARYAFGQ